MSGQNKTQNQLSPQQKHAFEHGIISWKAPSYVAHEKTWRWYLVAGIILSGLLIYAVISESWTFAVALITAAYIYIYTHQTPPKEQDIIISEIGIKEGNHYFPYSKIKGFWVIYEPPYVKQLHLIVDNRSISEFTIQLGDQDPAEVRNFLCSQIQEYEGKEETFLDLLTRRLKL